METWNIFLKKRENHNKTIGLLTLRKKSILIFVNRDDLLSGIHIFLVSFEGKRSPREPYIITVIKSES
ncbi:hypothetical protein CEXT_609011 [Caerostris extrusa]|uniref:Uncharacterized protein n=1 Tax=Caerostris extrusa TaxID=172846 RepID=A0AAV4UG17_CAEEX|nr:hypothetical protein CEXT_609011 [Caerostris extrusa]